jgi:hypothetical protein
VYQVTRGFQMPEQIVVMPFGKHRGHALDQVDSGYLAWCVRECSNLNADLRAAIMAELAQRRYRQGANDSSPRTPYVAPAIATNNSNSNYSGVDRAAVFDLLALSLATGVRVIARGDGAVHSYGAVNPDLRLRLAHHHRDLDCLAAWIAWESPGRPRHTPATALLARLRRDGAKVTALANGEIAVSMSPPADGADALGEIAAAGRREMWFRLAAHLPEPDDAAPSLAGAPPNALAGLHRHCQVRTERAINNATKGSLAERWQLWADAVSAVRTRQSGTINRLEDLLAYCLERSAAAERRGQMVAARRWRVWADALHAE